MFGHVEESKLTGCHFTKGHMWAGRKFGKEVIMRRKSYVEEEQTSKRSYYCKRPTGNYHPRKLLLEITSFLVIELSRGFYLGSLSINGIIFSHGTRLL